jgi:hypothetical protein
MRLTLIALLLLALPAFAGDKSVAQELYIEELQYTIESVHVKRSYGKSTKYDEFMLQKATERLNELSVQYIARSIFTNAIVNREPDQHVTVAPQNSTAFFFNELRGLQGAVVSHVWITNGVPVHRIEFNIGSDRWRTFSSISTRNASGFEVLVYINNQLAASHTLVVQ